MDGFGDRESFLTAKAERAFVRQLNGGCSSPVAAYGEVKGNMLFLRGLYYREEDGTYFIGEKKGPAEEAEEIGRILAKEMKEK